jgi:hypothetical protein
MDIKTVKKMILNLTLIIGGALAIWMFWGDEFLEWRQDHV